MEDYIFKKWIEECRSCRCCNECELYNIEGSPCYQQIENKGSEAISYIKDTLQAYTKEIKNNM